MTYNCIVKIDDENDLFFSNTISLIVSFGTNLPKLSVFSDEGGGWLPCPFPAPSVFCFFSISDDFLAFFSRHIFKFCLTER